MINKTAIKLAAISIAWGVGLYGEVAHAQVGNRLDERGSLLVYPLVTTIGTGCCGPSDTIINIANTSASAVLLECRTVLHGGTPVAPGPFVKDDFTISLTPHQKISWLLSQGSRGFGIEAKTGKGFMYCFAITGAGNERNFNFLKGDATLTGGQGATYNAIPHQALAITGDRVLNLDGVEYSAATARIWFEGFTENLPPATPAVTGELAVAGIDADFPASIQVDFDANYRCWDIFELGFSRHRHVSTFAQHHLTNDLNITQAGRFGSPTFLCRLTTTQTGTGALTPVHAVFVQFGPAVGGGLTATNVVQDLARRATTRIVLDDF